MFKFGLNDDFDKYNFNKSLNANPILIFDASNNYAHPIEADFGFGNGLYNQNNNEFGAYAQDDWSPTSRLTVNLGMRWDVETGMFNRNYVTPQAVVDSVTAYRSQLFVNVDPNRYFSNGHNRGLFLGAIQPRIRRLVRAGRRREHHGLRELRHVLRSTELQRDLRRDVPAAVPAVSNPVRGQRYHAGQGALESRRTRLAKGSQTSSQRITSSRRSIWSRTI